MRLSLASAVIIATLLVAPSAQAAPKSLRLADIAWMAGDWAGGLDNQRVSGYLSLPDGDSMAGFMKTIDMTAGKLLTYEANLIQQTPDGVVMFSHVVGPALVPFAMEPFDQIMVLQLVEASPTRCRWESMGDAPGSHTTEIITLEGDVERLMTTITVEGADHPMDFQMKRVGPAN